MLVLRVRAGRLDPDPSLPWPSNHVLTFIIALPRGGHHHHPRIQAIRLRPQRTANPPRLRLIAHLSPSTFMYHTAYHPDLSRTWTDPFQIRACRHSLFSDGVAAAAKIRAGCVPPPHPPPEAHGFPSPRVWRRRRQLPMLRGQGAPHERRARSSSLSTHCFGARLSPDIRGGT